MIVVFPRNLYHRVLVAVDGAQNSLPSCQKGNIFVNILRLKMLSLINPAVFLLNEVYVSREHLKPRLRAQFAPWCKFTHGCKITPGSTLAPPYVAFICQ